MGGWEWGSRVEVGLFPEAGSFASREGGGYSSSPTKFLIFSTPFSQGTEYIRYLIGHNVEPDIWVLDIGDWIPSIKYLIGTLIWQFPNPKLHI